MKRFRNVVAVVLLSVLVVLTSCSNEISRKGNEYGRNWYTFKKNMTNYDYPSEPNFTDITEAELKQFRKDMASDPEGRGATVEIYKGSFIYSEGNMAMRQNPDGRWWGYVTLGDGSVFLMQYTNEWNSKTAPLALPGKPNLKFVGWLVNEISPTCVQWMGMFINDRNTNINDVVTDYVQRLAKAGWSYGSDEYGEYFAKNINGIYTEVTFANFGPFYYLYMTEYRD